MNKVYCLFFTIFMTSRSRNPEIYVKGTVRILPKMISKAGLNNLAELFVFNIKGLTHSLYILTNPVILRLLRRISSCKGNE